MNKGALESITAISLGSVWAGPYTGRVLAEMGAEVIRVEFPGREIPTRNPEIEEAWVESLVSKGMSREDAEKAAKPIPTYQLLYQCNNYSLGLDLRNARGKEIYKKLVRRSDVIVDGWSSRVMASLQLDYSVLREVKPDIIYVSIPALGMTGPDKDVRMFGSGCEALAGLDSVRGYPDGEPYPSLGHIPDPIAAMHILVAILAALNYRDETGEGQYIDISQTECATVTMGEAIMDYSMNKRVARPQGNRHPFYAPHGCYRCQGDDMWVTIAVTSDEEWHRFCEALGNPEWTEAPKFSGMLGRWENQDELNRLIEEWTGQHDHYAVQEILQNAGVPAAAVVTLEEQITYDPQIKERDVYRRLSYHDGFDDPVFRVPWVLPETPSRLNWSGPYIGKHNNYVLAELLGMSENEIARLAEENIIGATPPAL